MNPLGYLGEQLVTEDIGEEIFALAAKIFPICRSITGNGVRETLREIGAHIALEMHEVPTGTKVFDWTIPREWNIRDAYIKDGQGKKLVDFCKSNLHVMSYSIPVRKHVSLEELRQHVHTLPEQPDLIPYRTSYYAEDWGFCMPYRQFEQLQDEIYEVVIDSSLDDGYLSYGEYLHRGETEDEFLLSAHVCHPSLANDNCSGVALLTHLAKRMSSCTDAIQLSLPVCTRDDRCNHVARAQRGQQPTHQARARYLHGRRWRRSNLQEKPARQCQDRSGRYPRSSSFRIDADDPRVFSLRLRRTAVLFARLQLAGRAVPTQQVRRDSPVSHLGRQS